MFEEILFMIGFALFSLLVSHLLHKYTPEPVYNIVKFLAIIGILIHEACHILMCLITNVRIEEIRILQTDKEEKKKRAI